MGIGKSSDLFRGVFVAECKLPETEQRRGEMIAATRARILQDHFGCLEEYLILKQVGREKERADRPDDMCRLHTTFVRTVHHMYLCDSFDVTMAENVSVTKDRAGRDIYFMVYDNQKDVIYAWLEAEEFEKFSSSGGKDDLRKILDFVCGDVFPSTESRVET